jgi:hypothetical protein
MFDETVCVTSGDNEAFVSFLQENLGRIVFLRSHLDASVSVEEQFKRVEEEGLDLDQIAAGRFSGMPLPLRSSRGGLFAVTFHFRDDHVLTSSAGGTGVLMVEIVGFFEVSATYHGGPTTAYHLKEMEAPFESKVDLLNRPRAQGPK